MKVTVILVHSGWGENTQVWRLCANDKIAKDLLLADGFVYDDNNGEFVENVWHKGTRLFAQIFSKPLHE